MLFSAGWYITWKIHPIISIVDLGGYKRNGGVFVVLETQNGWNPNKNSNSVRIIL